MPEFDLQFIKFVQALLIDWQYGDEDADLDIVADGEWGGHSEVVMSHVQNANGLEVTGELDRVSFLVLLDGVGLSVDDKRFDLDVLFGTETKPEALATSAVNEALRVPAANDAITQSPADPRATVDADVTLEPGDGSEDGGDVDPNTAGDDLSGDGADSSDASNPPQVVSPEPSAGPEGDEVEGADFEGQTPAVREASREEAARDPDLRDPAEEDEET